MIDFGRATSLLPGKSWVRRTSCLTPFPSPWRAWRRRWRTSPFTLVFRWVRFFHSSIPVYVLATPYVSLPPLSRTEPITDAPQFLLIWDIYLYKYLPVPSCYQAFSRCFLSSLHISLFPFSSLHGIGRSPPPFFVLMYQEVLSSFLIAWLPWFRD